MRSLLPALLGLLLGCSAAGEQPVGTGGGGGGTSTTTTSTGEGGASTTTTGGGGAGGDLNLGGGGPGTGGGPVGESEVFAHSADTLFRLDPDTKVVAVVGTFSGCMSNVLDIALDKDGVMYGSTSNGLYRITKETAACTFVAPGKYPNSLSFVPKGTLDPTKEALVGYVDADYMRIDTSTGEMTKVGSLNGGSYVSSGDIVSVINGGTYLTIKGGDCADCIVEVNPATGAIKKKIGALTHGQVFGVAFWGGVAYGFSKDGALFQIDLSSGKTTDIPMPNAPAGLSFWGAGSTTAAPVVPK